MKVGGGWSCWWSVVLLLVARAGAILIKMGVVWFIGSSNQSRKTIIMDFIPNP
jgi:hypothetical protein